MSYTEEFATISLIKASGAKTRGVDSFALSLIKAERQIRKLLTYLVFQYPCFTYADISVLKDTLSKNRQVYFEGVIKGFDAIYPKSVESLVGVKHQELRDKINKATQYRNKIFHGQLTRDNLSRTELFSYVDNISEWCRLLADGAENEIGYNGFTRNSFQKSSKNKIYDSFKISFQSVDDYKVFIKNNMQRP